MSRPCPSLAMWQGPPVRCPPLCMALGQLGLGNSCLLPYFSFIFLTRRKSNSPVPPTPALRQFYVAIRHHSPAQTRVTFPGRQPQFSNCWLSLNCTKLHFPRQQQIPLSLLPRKASRREEFILTVAEKCHVPTRLSWNALSISPCLTSAYIFFPHLQLYVIRFINMISMANLPV